MRRTSLSRRLLAGVAGLMVGLGTLLSTAPAQAQPSAAEHPVTFISVCEGTYVHLITPPGSLDPAWSIKAGSEDFWPPSDPIPGPDDSVLVFVPDDAGPIEVDFEDSSGPGWPASHTWEQPDGCADLPAPGHAAPTCEAAGEITIPGLPAEAVGEFGRDNLAYRLNGERVEPGSTHTGNPGSHVVQLVAGDEHTKIVVRTWTVDLDVPTCPNGALAETGARLVLMGGGALVLLTLGGGLYLMARRQISFVP